MIQESPLEYTIYDKYEDVSENIIYNLKKIKNKNAYDKNAYDKIVLEWKHSGIFKGNESLEKIDLKTLKNNLLVFFEANEGDNIVELEILDAEINKITPTNAVYGKKRKSSKKFKKNKSNTKKNKSNTKKSKSKKSKKGGRRMRMRK